MIYDIFQSTHNSNLPFGFYEVSVLMAVIDEIEEKQIFDHGHCHSSLRLSGQNWRQR